MADTEHVDALRQTDELPDELWRAYDEGEDACWSQPDHAPAYAQCCRRTGLAAALKLHEQQLRTGQPPLRDEYGMRVLYLSTRRLEAALGETADQARAAIAELDAEDRDDEHYRSDVISRTLIRRKVSDWEDVQESDHG